METTTQSRRKSMSGYQTILENRESRESLRVKSEEEKTRKSIETQSENAQKIINEQCIDIQNHYTEMVNAGKEMRNLQDQLDAKMKEEELFQKTADEVYALTDIDETNVHKMKLRKYAYHGLPILDCFFAFFALYPIITSKFAEASEWGQALVVPVGVVLSTAVGYGLSLLSRLAVSSLDDGDKSSGMAIMKKTAIGFSMFALPLMYVIGELCFNGGESWTYSGSFAFISLVIQLLIVSGYKNQIDALKYFDIIKQNNDAKTARNNDENAIKSEIMVIKEKMQSLITSFNATYIKFTEKFAELAAARREYIKLFAKDPGINLNQLVIFFGDLVCFRHDEIPLHRNENGLISILSPINFPNVAGSMDINKSYDYVYLEYMLQQTKPGISLSETIRALDAGGQQKLSMSSGGSQAGNTDTRNEPTDTTGKTKTGGIWD